MPEYEMVLIFAEGKDLKAQVEKVKTFIEKEKGKLTKAESLGLKSFTYPIQKHPSGQYERFFFSIDPEKIPVLEKSLKLDPKILRILVLFAKGVRGKHGKISQ